MLARAGSHVAVFAALALAGGMTDSCKSCKKAGDAPDSALADAATSAQVSDASATFAFVMKDSGAMQTPPTTTIATATAIPKPPPPSGPIVAGELWSGSFSCRGSTDFKLQVMNVTTSEIDAVFVYTRAKVQGRMRMRGTYNPSTRRVLLLGEAWLSHPGTDSLVNLDGTVSTEGRSIKGSVKGPGCSTFTLHR